MKRCLKEIEKRMATVEEAARVENVGRLEQKVKTISDKQDRTRDKMDKKIEQRQRRMFEELREREAKRLNIVMHGMEELKGN
jgi:hypothetical protein